MPVPFRVTTTKGKKEKKEKRKKERNEMKQKILHNC
jgi:hypothetical protein